MKYVTRKLKLGRAFNYFKMTYGKTIFCAIIHNHIVVVMAT